MKRKSLIPTREVNSTGPDLVRPLDWGVEGKRDLINSWASEFARTHGKTPSVKEVKGDPYKFWVIVSDSTPPMKWEKADFIQQMARLQKLPTHADTEHLPAQPASGATSARTKRRRRKRSARKSIVFRRRSQQ